MKKIILSFVLLFTAISVIAQTKIISLKEGKVTQIILHDNIKSFKGGFEPDNFAISIESNVLYIQPVEAFPESNMNIITNDESYFAFTIRYDSTTNNFNYILNSEDALFRKNEVEEESTEKSYSTTTPSYTGKISPETLPTTTIEESNVQDASITDKPVREWIAEPEQASNLILKRKGYLTSYNTTSIKNLTLTLKGIYVHLDKMFFRLYIENDSYIKYDLEYIAFYVRAIKSKKSTTDELLQLHPIYIHNPISTIEPKQAQEIIYCFDKFTIGDKKVLNIDMIEKGGERNLSLPVSTNMIINAKNIW